MWQTEFGLWTHDGNACHEPTIYSLAVTRDSGFWLALPKSGRHVQRPYSNMCYTHCVMIHLVNSFLTLWASLGFIGFVGFRIIVVQLGGTSYDQGSVTMFQLHISGAPWMMTPRWLRLAGSNSSQSEHRKATEVHAPGQEHGRPIPVNNRLLSTVWQVKRYVEIKFDIYPLMGLTICNEYYSCLICMTLLSCPTLPIGSVYLIYIRYSSLAYRLCWCKFPMAADVRKVSVRRRYIRDN
jgi:hypothetical protein